MTATLSRGQLRRLGHLRGFDGHEKVELDQAKAERLAASMTDTTRVTYQAYRCRYCDHWHVGRPKTLHPRGPNERLHHLWWEIGERATGCMRAENNPDKRLAGRHIRNLAEAAGRRRLGVLSRPGHPRWGRTRRD